jgi:predicted site-specific integrase-resolvase
MNSQLKIKHSARLVPRKEATFMLGYQSPITLYRMELAGKLKPVRVNSRRTCYALEDIQRLMEGN